MHVFNASHRSTIAASLLKYIDAVPKAARVAVLDLLLLLVKTGVSENEFNQVGFR